MATWFYKDGIGKVFEGECPEGWTDHPAKKAVPKKKKVAKKKAK